MSLKTGKTIVLLLTRIVIKIFLGYLLYISVSNKFTLLYISLIVVSEVYEFIGLYLSSKIILPKNILGICIVVLDFLIFSFIVLSASLPTSVLVLIVIILSLLQLALWEAISSILLYFSLNSLIIYVFYIKSELNNSNELYLLFSFLIFLIVVLGTHRNELSVSMAQINKADSNDSDNTIDEFIALSADNLRTPVTVLKTFLNSYNNTTKNEDPQKRTVEAMSHNINKLARIVDNILNLSQVNKLFPQSYIVSADLQSLIDSAVKESQSFADSKAIKLKVAKPPFPLTVKVNPDGIKFIMKSIIDNAIKFSTVTSEVYINSAKEGNFAIFSVQDTGRGIEKSEIDNLFKKFHKVDNYLITESGSGMGIGLYISKKVIDAHKGKITVKSEIGKGSTFFVYIPMS